MEPCPFRQGNETRMPMICARRAASMEPCPFRQGNLRRLNRLKPSASRLQWSPAPFRQGNRRHSRYTRQPSRRFNGALPIQAGKQRSHVLGRVSYGTLQWSPAHSGRETCFVQALEPLLLTRFKWSPAHSGRETFSRCSRRGAPIRLQWSPAHSGRETGPCA